MQHQTVLLQEATNALNIQPTDTIVDATYGSGGHAAKMLEYLGAEGTLVAVDVDSSALEKKPANPNQATVHLIPNNFRNIQSVLNTVNITAVNGILADLGWRMEQFSGNGRGLSFQYDEPLLMTLGEPEEYPFTASEIINTWNEATIADIIYGYGEERFARRIAKKIVTKREESPIETTCQLRDVILEAIPKRAHHNKIHPATRTFQALRIAVNEELAALEEFISEGFDCLAKDGRLAIISFHSLEDRIVKLSFRKLAEQGLGTLVTKKPLTPTPEELNSNPKARSAKLRIIQKLT